MINRDNYKLTKEFLKYLSEVKQLHDESLRLYWQAAKHLLQWADENPILSAPKIRPTFPEYLMTARNVRHPGETSDKPLSPRYMAKVLSEVRIFFKWLREHKKGYAGLNEAWIDTLRPRRSAGAHTRLKERQYWRLDDIRAVMAVKPATAALERDKAALAFLFLSGMRIGAFVTLPTECVDLERRRIEQLPEKGVRTKNSKAAITYLLNIPDLLSIIAGWHEYITSFGVGFLWYPALDNQGVPMRGYIDVDKSYNGRHTAFIEGLRELCEIAGIPYKSPHKIRHGFGVYGVKKAKDMGQLKAVSQNMMHSNIGITDGIYGRLAEDELGDIIGSLGE